MRVEQKRASAQTSDCQLPKPSSVRFELMQAKVTTAEASERQAAPGRSVASRRTRAAVDFKRSRQLVKEGAISAGI